MSAESKSSSGTGPNGLGFLPSGIPWVDHVRHYIVRREDTALEAAAHHCGDERITALINDTRREGRVAPSMYMPIAAALAEEGRPIEGAGTLLVGWHWFIPLAEMIGSLSPDWQALTLDTLSEARGLCASHRFRECSLQFGYALANALTSLGHGQAALDAARTALSTGLRIERSGYPELRRTTAATALLLGQLYTGARKPSAGRRYITMAIRAIAGGGMAEPLATLSLATAYDALHVAYHAERLLPEALESAERAITQCRHLCKQYGQQFTTYLAGMLHNHADTLFSLGAYDDALPVYREALALQQQAGVVKVGAQALLGTYLGLTNTLLVLDQLDEAGAVATAGMDYALAEVRAGRHSVHLVFAKLLDVSSRIIFRRGLPQQALASSRMAMKLLSRARSAHLAERLRLASGVLTRMAECAFAMGNRDRARVLALRAIRVGEGGSVPLSDARAIFANAYRIVLDTPRITDEAVWRNLLPLVDGTLNSTNLNVLGELDAVCRCIGSLAEQVRKPVALVLATEIAPNSPLFGIIESSKPCQSHYVRAQTAAPFQELRDAAGVTACNADIDDTSLLLDRLRAMGQAAWSALPKEVTRLFTSSDSAIVLLCCDEAWSSFPWETLHTGEHSHSWLGMSHALTRLDSLPRNTRHFAPRRIGRDRDKTAGLIVPSTGTIASAGHLRHANTEATLTTKLLKELGFAVVPSPDGVKGRAARRSVFLNLLGETLALLHYAGHCESREGEQYLLCASEDGGREPSRVSARDLRELSLGHGGIAAHRIGLVVLNACRTGQLREFGGIREDIAGAFLHHVADSVIAHRFPIGDAAGSAFAVLFYSASSGGDVAVGERLCFVRRMLLLLGERVAPSFAQSWIGLVCYGNPYAELATRTTEDGGGDGSEDVVVGHLLDALGVSEHLTAARMTIAEALNEAASSTAWR